MTWHRKPASEIFAQLGSGPHGLSEDEAARRLAKHGPNEIAARKPPTALAAFGRQFRQPIVLLLIGAAAVSGAIGGAVDAAIICAIVALNAVVGAVQEHRAERAMAALRRMAAPQAVVVRDGRRRTAPAREVVVGDVVEIEAGQAVPADLRLFESRGLTLGESALTGEAEDVAKDPRPLDAPDLPLGDRTNMAYAGTTATKGRGAGVAVAVAMEAEMGRIAAMLGAPAGPTPLQRRMASFGRAITIAVLAICVAFFVVGRVRGEEPLGLLLTSISLAVAAVPEALPALMTATLALAAARMAKQRALVRRLAAVETLGSVTYACVDKTGTLTQNRMRVERTVPAETPGEAALLRAMALNNDVVVDPSGAAAGEGTELALYEHAAAHGALKADLLRAAPRVAEAAFDSERKRMSTVHREDGGFSLYCKGAPETLSPRLLAHDGRWLAAAEALAAEGYRVMAYGYRRLPDGPTPTDVAALETELTPLGIVGLFDPPRDAAPQAVADCLRAGVRPVAITGDHPTTARALATRIGLMTPEEAADPQSILTGPELVRLGPAGLAERVEKVRVFARVSPEQKVDIVAALQARGHYVAMTGDGVNDAPALRRADIGVAMGGSGTDVAREAADVVLLDDDFATLARAIREGRRVYDNIRKFVRYVLAGNAGEIVAVALAPLCGMPVPLLPVHILWVNLVTDGLPGLALALEPAEADIMARPPRPPKEGLFARGLGTQVLWIGALIGGVTLAAEAWAIADGAAHWRTVAFNVLCLSQMGQALAVRTEAPFFRSKPFGNPALLGAVALTVVLQAAVTYVPARQSLFKTTALTVAEVGVVLALSAVVFVVVEAAKSVRHAVGRRRRRPGS